MNGELGPLTVRQVGITDRRTVPPVARAAAANRAAVTRRALEGEEKKDIFDTVIAKAEEIRASTIGACPVTQLEDAWVKLNQFAIDVTPSIPILPTTPTTV